MRIQIPRRASIFFIAIALPCVGLVAAGVRMIRNGDEVSAVRKIEGQSRAVARLASSLLSRLERIRLEETSRLTSASVGAYGRQQGDLALVARVRMGRLMLPWKDAPAVSTFARITGDADSSFGQALAFGQRLETILQFPDAVRAYDEARSAAGSKAETDFADLLRARALGKDARPAEAMAVERALLDSETIDEEGVPLALYAARRLLDHDPSSTVILDRLEPRVAQWHSISPIGLSLLGEVIENARKLGVRDRVAAQAERLTAVVKTMRHDQERTLALDRELPRILAAAAAGTPGEPVWIPLDDSAWLVGVSRLETEPVLVAVRSATLLSTSSPETTVLTTSPQSLRLSVVGGDRSLGPAFPGVKVLFLPIGTDPVWNSQRRLYVAGLVSVIVVALLGGLVVWRDVRREVRVAEQRAQFVASVSHELKTPLTSIRMFAETLQMDHPLSQSARAEYLQTIVNESERLTRLINNVLDYSMIERGQKVYRFQPAALSEVLKSAARTMQYPLARLGFGLRLDVKEDVPPARVDPDALAQAVLNLLSNAMKYSRDRREIDLRLFGTNDHAVIEVTDYGLGIPAEEQLKIFGRFYRAEVPENSRIPGAGLGLALVDHIVRAHGGVVEVRSAPGEGSTFAIHLPIATPALDGSA